ncbi:MAG: T9SS type A sorting domain-containing protein [Bacteroidota bacterium]
MKGLIITLLVVLTHLTHSFAQSSSPSVSSSAGESFQGVNLKLDWTLGELAIESLENSSRQLTQGFHQPQYLLTNSETLPAEVGYIKVFPNPVANSLKVDLLLREPQKVELSLLDLQGRKVWTKSLFSQNVEAAVEMSSLPVGTYFLHLTYNNRKTLKTYAIQKLY